MWIKRESVFLATSFFFLFCVMTDVIGSLYFDTDKLDRLLDGVQGSLHLNNSKLEEAVTFFQSEMRRGLAGEESSLVMLPAYISKVQFSHDKTRYPCSYLAIDLGGTNIRVLKVSQRNREAQPKIVHCISSSIEKKIMESPRVSLLFDDIARKLKILLKETGDLNTNTSFVLGFTFSFAFEQRDINAACILNMAKGFTAAKEAIGKDPVKLLELAIADNGIDNVRVGAIINDTTGTFLTGMQYPDCDAGVILGTGFNICLEVPVKHFKKKVSPFCGDKMVVVLESGDFNVGKVGMMTKFDEEVDRSSKNTGKYLAEKMMSGKYLGRLFRFIIKEAINPESEKYLLSEDAIPTKCMSEIEALPVAGIKESMNELLGRYGVDIKVLTDGDAMKVQKLCALISDRSAKLLAACLTGVARFVDPKMERTHTIAIDGSVYKKYNGYKKKVDGALRFLTKENVFIKEIDDGSGIGAALAAGISANR